MRTDAESALPMRLWRVNEILDLCDCRLIDGQCVQTLMHCNKTKKSC
jgi:hypothetical protein